MGKRSNFPKRKRDFYVTPKEALDPLLPYIIREDRISDLTAGDGALCRHLHDKGFQIHFASDIEPKKNDDNDFDIQEMDIFSVTKDMVSGSIIIMNPPWSRDKASGYLLHRIITHCLDMGGLFWLLFDADWMHTKQAEPFLKHCHTILSVGRVSWMGNGTSGKDNACWYGFGYSPSLVGWSTHFIGNGARK